MDSSNTTPGGMIVIGAVRGGHATVVASTVPVDHSAGRQPVDPAYDDLARKIVCSSLVSPSRAGAIWMSTAKPAL